MDYWIYISIFGAAVAIFSMINILMSHMAVNRKILWFTLVVVFPIVGPMIYLWKRNTL